jgi:ketosteroid isomerase-like protein
MRLEHQERSTPVILALLTLIVLIQATPASPDRAKDRAQDRAQDREKIRAHIDRIFQAFIHKSDAELRATHDENWLGYLQGSRTMIRGVDAYMADTGGFTNSDYGMTGYTMREFDMIFQGDAAFVTFIADIDYKTPGGPLHRALRITDFYVRRNGAWIQAGSDTDEDPAARQAREQMPQTLDAEQKKELLDARETVWRSFFSNDRAALEKLIPEDTIVMDPGSSGIGNRAGVMEGAAGFAKSGAKLARLEFPSTEIQCYGNTAVLYSTYQYELENDGKRTPFSGRITEVFVFRKGQWVNPGWHMEAVK